MLSIDLNTLDHRDKTSIKRSRQEDNPKAGFHFKRTVHFSEQSKCSLRGLLTRASHCHRKRSRKKNVTASTEEAQAFKVEVAKEKETSPTRNQEGQCLRLG